MTQNRYYSNIANTTTLTNPGGINSGALQIQVGATTGFPVQFPFILRIEPATLSEEVVLVTSGAGTSSNPYQVTRGYDGTVARAHSQGVVVKHGFAQIDFAEPQQHLNSTGPGGAPNPHGLPDWAFSTLPGCSLLYSSTLSSTALSITISSIPATYNNLRMYVSALASTATTLVDMNMQFNSDTAAHYGWGEGYVTSAATTGSGSHTANGTAIKIATIWGNSSAVVPGVAVVDIPMYSQTTLQKGILSVGSAQDGGNISWNLGYIGGVWMSTAAINTITLTLSSSTNFAAGTSISLYGLV